MNKSEARGYSRKRFWLPFFVLGAGILLTLTVTHFVSQNLTLRAEQKFRAEIVQAEAQIYTLIEAYIALLRGGGALFAVDEWIDPKEFEAFYYRLRIAEFYPGVQGIGVAVRITPENREELMGKIRRDYPDFKVWPDEGQSDACAIYLLQPMDERNSAAIGYDMFSEPKRRAAMIRARDTTLPSATAKLSLVQEIQGPKQPGFLIYLPLYAGGELPATVEERRAKIQGFVYAPFRTHDFLSAVAELERGSGIEFQVYDGTEVKEENLLFDSAELGEGFSTTQDVLEAVDTIEIAGHPWTIRFLAAPVMPAAVWVVPLLSISGLILTFALAYLTYTESLAWSRVEQAHRDLQRSQSALQASEELHRTVMQTASDGIIVSDGNGVIQSINEAAERILGYERGELLGKKLVEIVPERLRQRHIEGFQRYIRTGKRLMNWSALQMPGLRKDGSEVPLEISYGSFMRGNTMFLTGILRDVSERHKAEEAIRASQLQLQTIADGLPVLIGAVDRDLRYRFNNRTYQRWFGEKASDLRGKPMQEVLSKEAFQELKPFLDEGLSGREVEFELEIRYPENGPRHIHGTIIPEFNQQGNVLGLFLLIMDISDRKRREIRTQFLVQAGNLLVESLDYKETLARVARLAVPTIADFCLVNLLDDKRELQCIEAVHSDPEKLPLVRELGEMVRELPRSDILGLVYNEGRSLLKAEVEPEFLREIAGTREQLRVLEAVRMRSLISVPIRGRSGAYGVLIFAMADSRRIYTADDLRSVEELAARVGLAVENALYFQEAQREIEERRSVERALRESEERFRIMVEQARDYAIFMMDPEGRISSWNSGAERILGYTEEEIVGKEGKVLFTPEDQTEGAAERELQIAREKGKALDERWHLRKDGSRFFCSGYVFALRDDAGELRGFTKIMRDVTERKRWEEDIQRLNQELETRVEQRTAALRESYEQMEAFTYTVAHDLRAPLRSMRGFSEAVLEESGHCLNENSRDFLRRVIRSAGRMDALIQDLLAYSHLARTDLVFESVDLQGVIDDVLTVQAEEIQERNVSLVLNGPFPPVHAHRATLHTVVSNLVSNAIKFTSTAKSPRVELRAERCVHQGKQMVRLWVIDNGIGISEEHHERIFRVFERLHGPQSYTGTGIGLAIVKKGVERMNGRVGVESKMNEGSRFWIELPEG